MAGKPQWNKKTAQTEAVAWVEQNKRWPRASGPGPFSESVGVRLWGSWSLFLEDLRRLCHAKHGVFEWDDRRPRLSDFRKQVLADTLDIVEASLRRLKSLKPTRPILPKRDAKKDPAEIHLLISDVHVGEMNDPNLMSGLVGPEGYNFSVFQEQADRLEERVMFFRDLYSRAWLPNKLVVNMLGDIVTGEQIFQGQALQIDRILTEQVFEAAHRFACMVRNWSARFEEVEVYCMPGNHGRIGKKGELHWKSNMDYVVYRVMAILLKDCPNIRFIIAEGPFLVVEHGDGWRFLIHHGDAVPGAGASKGNFVSLERKVHQFSQMSDVTLHYSLTGHVHRSGSVALAGGGRIFSNGSFPGGSPFSVAVVGDVQVPSQKLLLFHPIKGVFCETDMLLADRVSLKKDENRVYTANYRTTG